MTAAENTSQGSPFWRFSLGFYRRAGVADACIALQDEAGVDVNLLLFLLWSATEKKTLSLAAVADLDGLIAPWHAMAGRFDAAERVVDHIRELGRQISHDDVEESVLSSQLALRLWQGRSLEVVPFLQQFNQVLPVFSASVAVYLWRAGEQEQRGRLGLRPPPRGRIARERFPAVGVCWLCLGH